MKHKQGEQTFYNPEMGLLWPPGDLYGHHSEQEHRASLLACTVTLDCFQLLLEEWTNCIWFLSTLKLTAIVRIVMNFPWFQEIFPQNWRVSPQIAAPSPLWPADSIKIDGPLITQTISWNHSLNGLKWSHLTNMGCEAFEMIPHISLSSGKQCPVSHFEIFVTSVTFLTKKIYMVRNENSYQVQIARVTTGLISPLLLPPLRGRDGQLEVRITAITAHFLSPQATS